MEPKELWNIYMHGMPPADFMSAFDEADPAMCVTEYVRQRPAFYGIVRRRNWSETFAPGEAQYTRESVRAALITHLEETRPEWEPVSAEIRQRRQEERRRRIEEAARVRESAPAEAAAPVEPAPAPESTVPEPVAAVSEAVSDPPAADAPDNGPAPVPAD